LKPYYPVSDFYRVVNDDQGLQLDFMAKLHGIRSFKGLKSRSVRVEFGTESLLVASLADIIKSKRAVDAIKTWLCSTSWSKLSVSMKITKKPSARKSAEDALRKESDHALIEQIRRLLALPMNKRTNFLRVRHPSGGSHL
jgi:hypothetical protein